MPGSAASTQMLQRQNRPWEFIQNCLRLNCVTAVTFAQKFFILSPRKQYEQKTNISKLNTYLVHKLSPVYFYPHHPPSPNNPSLAPVGWTWQWRCKYFTVLLLYYTYICLPQNDENNLYAGLKKIFNSAKSVFSFSMFGRFHEH